MFKTHYVLLFFFLLLSKICIPGLHISLGVFLNFYELLLDECAELDAKIAYKLAEDSSELGNSRLDDDLVKKLREAKQHETAAATYFTEAKAVEEYACYVVNWMRTDQPQNPNPLVQQLLEHSHTLKQNAEQEVWDSMHS